MIDIHCHILWGVDDGPAVMKETLAMADVAAEDGIEKIVASPHVINQLPPPERIVDLVDGLNLNLQIRGIPVQVVVGGEVVCMTDPAAAANYTINGSSYVLVEFPHTHMPINARQILFNLQIHGLKPIIAHPERNPSIIDNPDLLAELLTGNIYSQLTSCSLTGKFGGKIQKCATKLLEKGLVHFIGTDSHGITFRRPMLTPGLQVAEKIIGAAAAARLVKDNPQAVLENEDISA